jgi:hypothetical protein
VNRIRDLIAVSRTAVAVSVGVACLVSAIGTTAAAATTISVNTTATTFTMGDGLCSLYEAINYANGTAEPDCSSTARSGTTTINVPSGKYTVAAGLELSGPTNIVGAGGAHTDMDGDGLATVFSIGGGTVVSISGVEISGGYSGGVTADCTGSGMTLDCPYGEAGNAGGGISNAGNLTLENDIVDHNKATDGTGPIHPGFTICITECAGGSAAYGGDGGGIYNGGTLTVVDSTIADNNAGSGGDGADATHGVGASGDGANGGSAGAGGLGGGIANFGTLTVTNSTITGNSAGSGGSGGSGTDAASSGSNGGASGDAGQGGGGGGIYSQDPMTITGSTIASNHGGQAGTPGTPGAGGGGGGMPGYSGSAGYGGAGGGVEISDAANDTNVFTNDTLTDNTAGLAASGTPTDGGTGGGIASEFGGSTSLTNDTIAANSAPDSSGGGVFTTDMSPIAERNSIIASNTSAIADNCGGTAPIDAGHNLVYADSTCPGTGSNPQLGSLASNGGPTQTLALRAGSGAVDLVPAPDCVVIVDQRGVSRPQGSACDAGSYELAPPTVSGVVATAGGPGSAAVTAQIGPNLTDTKVTVDFGTTASYGSATPVQDIGAGGSAAAVSVALTGLAAGSTYHAKVVATNQDGTTSSGDLTFTTPVAMTASVTNRPVKGNLVAVSLACAANGPGCSGALKLQSRVTTEGKKVVAVAASGKKKRPRPKRKTKVETVGSGRYTVAAGQTKVVKLTLDAAGKRLLKARHRLPTTLTITGPTRLTKKVTFDYKPPRKKKR